jgi:hypothetical protein
MNKNLTAALMFSFALLFSMAIQADNTKKYELHTVHYTAFPSDSLPSQMTKKYKLKRSKNMALVNISVIKNQPSIPIQGVKSTVAGTVKNLMSQEKTLSFKEVHEGEAYYYIAQVPVEHNEMVKFKIQIKTADNQSYDVDFGKQFTTK